MSSGSIVVEEGPAAPDGPSRDEDEGAGGSNRLAPYNPTHDTAQTAALDLLQLTSRDVFFDLGCGDGRLIVAALERCYDDEYLMRVHQQRFARLQLQEEREGQGQQQQQSHIRHTSSDLGTPSSSSHHKKISHTRSLSTDYSVPHLMRTSSQDDASEDISVVTPLKNNNAGSSSQKDADRGDGNDGDRGDGNDGDGVSAHHDGSSAFSQPASQQRVLALMPTSPETPVVCNRKVQSLDVSALSDPLPTLPCAASSRDATTPATVTFLDESDFQQQIVSKNFERQISQHTPREDVYDEGGGIPTCIETPSPTGKRGSFHQAQISELPTDYSSLGEQLLATVPSGDDFPEDNDDIAAALLHVKGGKEELLGGLRCVGIEYSQALADAGKENVQKSYVYPHVEERVCIRWGDVLDEWSRGRDHDAGRENDDLRLRRTAISDSDHDDGGGEEGDASNLTLLDDATAVFVYLLPQGLRKVKPLLHEAAMRRKRQQERRQWEIQQQLDRRQMQKVQELQQLQQPQEPMHPLHPLQQPLREELEGPSSDAIPKQLVHGKHVSHVSDITDCDFMIRPGSRVDSLDSQQKAPLNEEEAGDGVRNDGKMLTEIPSFRVASYMFSIPGWTPTKVDRSGKGNCPVYLYEVDSILTEEGG